MAPKRLQPKANEHTNPGRSRQSPTPAKPQITTDAAELLQLQRSAGNRAVVRLLDRRRAESAWRASRPS